MSDLSHKVTPTFNKSIYHSLLEFGADLTPSTRPAAPHKFVLVQVSPSNPSPVDDFSTLDDALRYVSDRLEIYDHGEVHWETHPPLLQSYKQFGDIVAVWQIDETYELLMVKL